MRLWRKHEQEEGLEGLQLHRAPEQSSRIPKTLAPTIEGGARWSAGRWARLGALNRYSTGALPLSADGDRGQVHRDADLLAAPWPTSLAANVSLSPGQPRAAATSAGRAGGMQKNPGVGMGAAAPPNNSIVLQHGCVAGDVTKPSEGILQSLACAKPLIQKVGAPGFEPGTFGSQNRRATKLRYAPSGWHGNGTGNCGCML